MAECASCGASNREGQKFCTSCGAPYEPGQRFADLVGFTALSESRETEDVRGLLLAEAEEIFTPLRATVRLERIARARAGAGAAVA